MGRGRTAHSGTSENERAEIVGVRFRGRRTRVRIGMCMFDLFRWATRLNNSVTDNLRCKVGGIKISPLEITLSPLVLYS